MTATTLSTALVTIQSVFTESGRLARAGFLAGYRGLTREVYTWGGDGLEEARNTPARLVSIGGLLQRASIITGFTWLSALFARALRRMPTTAAPHHHA